MKKVLDRNVSFKLKLSVITLTIISMPNISNAARLNYSLGMEAEYSDNSNLSSTNENDELRRSILAGISLEENTSKLVADLRSLIEYNDYRDDAFEDESAFYLNSTATWTIRPSSFFWVIEDYYSQQRLNSLNPGTPDNLINTNVFSTGPDLSFRLDPANQINIGTRVSDYRYEDNDADSQRAVVNLSWLYGLSSYSDISINYEYQKANFEVLDESDFDRQDLFFRIETQRSRSSFQIDLGASDIKRKTLENVDGFLARLLWRNQFREQSHFQLDIYSQYTDSGLNLLTSGAQNTGFDRAGEQISGDIFYDKNLEATYQFNSSASSYNIQAGIRDEDYETFPQDRRTRNLSISYEYPYSLTTTISSQLRYQHYDNLDVDQIDRERTGNLAINYQLSRDYTLRIEYSLNTQESNIPSGVYNENRILFSFFYGSDPGSYR